MPRCYIDPDPEAAVLPVVDADGAERCRLQARPLRWPCREGELAVQLLAVEPVPEPPVVADVPLRSALASLLRWARGVDALVRLHRPAASLSEQDPTSLQGTALIDIDEAADRALWDRILSAGLPIYGCCGRLRLQLTRVDPLGVLLALRYGDFLACAGLEPLRWAEDVRGCEWELPAAGSASIVVRGGLEAAQVDGRTGRWRDRGQEGYVRCELRVDAGVCYSQPRLIAPLDPVAPGTLG